MDKQDGNGVDFHVFLGLRSFTRWKMQHIHTHRHI